LDEVRGWNIFRQFEKRIVVAEFSPCKGELGWEVVIFDFVGIVEGAVEAGVELDRVYYLIVLAAVDIMRYREDEIGRDKDAGTSSGVIYSLEFELDGSDMFVDPFFHFLLLHFVQILISEHAFIDEDDLILDKLDGGIHYLTHKTAILLRVLKQV
jgi:hypothetical protein